MRCVSRLYKYFLTVAGMRLYFYGDPGKPQACWGEDEQRSG